MASVSTRKNENAMYSNDKVKTRTMRAQALARLQDSTDVHSTPPPAGGVPTIRLTAATPSNAGSSFESNVSSPTFHVPQAHALPSLNEKGSASPLAPSTAPRKKLVPKKSKLGLLGMGAKKEKERDLSDVVRRVGVNGNTASTRGGFEIYVDPAEDPEIGEVIIVKKKKSRVALDSVFGESRPLADATNIVPQPTADVLPRKKSSLGPLNILKRSTGAASVLKSEDERDQKWWTINRGRKDSKPTSKESKGPDAIKSSPANRNRFNSLDSGILLNSPITSDLPAELEEIEIAARSADATKLTFAPAPKTSPRAPPSMGRSISFNPASIGRSVEAPQMARSNSAALATSQNSLLAPPSQDGEKLDASNSGSIAVRAMRSMRSLAHISSWAQLKGDGSVRAPKEKEEKETKENKAPKEVKEQPAPAKEAKSGKKEKKSKKDKSSTLALRTSGSSFEAGALSPAVSPLATKAGSERKSTLGLGDRKKSLLGLGLGWPTTLRSPTSPAAEVPMSIKIVPPEAQEPVATRVPPSAFASATQRLSMDAAKRLSADSTMSVSELNMAAATVGRARAGSRSTMSSTNSSLRPLSSSSGTSAGSCGSSIVSVRWDEEGLATVKENRERERASRPRSRMESRRGSEERRRTSLASVFPETREQIRSASGSSQKDEVVEEEEEVKQVAPRVTIETATLDGHEIHDDEEEVEEDEESVVSVTPAKLPRPRPMSEQLLGKARPRAVTDDSEGVLSILDAATNELASLIGRLDLEATPATPDLSPLKASPMSSFLESIKKSASSASDTTTTSKKPELDSPTKRPEFLRGLSASSITSLRPYAQSRNAKASTGPSMSPIAALPISTAMAKGQALGQQIAPWRVLNKGISPGKPRVPSAVKPLPRPSHMRTMTPDELPEEVVIQPLKPPGRSTSRVFIASPAKATPTATSAIHVPHGSSTFGRRSARKMLSHLSSGSIDETDSIMGSPSPVFRPPPGHQRKRSSLVPIDATIKAGKETAAVPSVQDVFGSTANTSIASSLAVNPKRISDLPDDLHDLLDARGLKSRVEDEMSGNESSSGSDTPSSPGAPPEQPLPQINGALTLAVPVFRLIDEEQRLSDIDLTSPIGTSDDDTNKSFEFTEELKRLNESGVGERRSFVEQLETAFQTPAKLDLKYGFGEFLAVDAPPVPTIPEHFLQEKRLSAATDLSAPDSIMDTTEEEEESHMLTNNVDSLGMSKDISSIEMGRAPEPDRSEGELNMHFKFGGRPSPSTDMPSSVGHSTAPMTLSDIIPSAEHVRRHSAAPSLDNVSFDMLLAQASLPSTSPSPSRERTDSDSTSKRRQRNLALSALNGAGRPQPQQVQQTKVADASYRPTSQVSFTGFNSFEEVRRGFEFAQDRPGFYSSASDDSARPRHKVQDSIASVSSFGSVWHAGARDPFGYSQPNRPVSTSDMSFSFSMSTEVDDTFAYLKHDPYQRRTRVDSDASTYSFHAPAPAPAPNGRMPIYSRPSHRRDQSTASVSSMAPPVSLYNRSFGHGHRRNMSSGSASSVAISYAMHGAQAAAGRASWARHRHNMSVDSTRSDLSALRVARPGMSEKMFDSAPMSMSEYGMPLSAISASPTASEFDESQYSMNMSFAAPYPYDSIMDAPQMAGEGDSIFERTEYRTQTVEEESIFGGADDSAFMPSVRPFRPVSILSTGSEHRAPLEDDTLISMIGGGHVRRLSVGSIINGSPCARVEKDKRVHAGIKGINLADRLAALKGSTEEPALPRIVEKASFASTSSFKFGDNRMDQARNGSLKRDSLEFGCLSADGEDTSASVSDAPRAFRRPVRTARKSSNPYASSGAETPPLSADDNFSMSGGSESSIDVGHLTMLLSNMSHPSTMFNNARTRPRGRGHRHRISQARMSRSSVYETIEEEQSVNLGPPAMLDTILASPMPPPNVSDIINDSVRIVDSDSPRSSGEWDPNHGISMRKYFALKNEACETVEESKRVWQDTPFSVFAVQSFEPPRHPDGMAALLQHSQLNYNELPAFRRVRSRTSSRASPYARAAVAAGVSFTTHSTNSSIASITEVLPSTAVRAQVLQPIVVHTNMLASPSPAKSTKSAKRTFLVNAKDLPEKDSKNATIRPRVNSSARRSALGWAKRGAKSSSDQKENTSAGSLMNPNESLKLSRPRPRGRPTPARSGLRA